MDSASEAGNRLQSPIIGRSPIEDADRGCRNGILGYKMSRSTVSQVLGTNPRESIVESKTLIDIPSANPFDVDVDVDVKLLLHQLT